MKAIKILKLSLAASVLLGMFASCEKESALDSKSVLDTTPKAMSPLDTWLKDTYTTPYNIAVDYKWDQYKVDNNRYLTPPSPSNVQKVMKVVKKVWIDSYTEVTYSEFIKEYTNREIVLVGGVNLNKDGTVTLGLADQGQRITLFTVDLINVSSVPEIRRFIHTIQHEYVHILNQKKVFDKKEYGEITPGGYDSNWSNISPSQALSKGFITPYSCSNVDEDFAEIAASMLVDINAFNTTVNNITNVTGKASIRAKEALVVDYYKMRWNIDFYELCKVADRNTILASQGL